MDGDDTEPVPAHVFFILHKLVRFADLPNARKLGSQGIHVLAGSGLKILVFEGVKVEVADGVDLLLDRFRGISLEFLQGHSVRIFAVQRGPAGLHALRRVLPEILFMIRRCGFCRRYGLLCRRLLLGVLSGSFRGGVLRCSGVAEGGIFRLRGRVPGFGLCLGLGCGLGGLICGLGGLRRCFWWSCLLLSAAVQEQQT